MSTPNHSPVAVDRCTRANVKERAQEMHDLFVSGLPYAAIGKKFGVSAVAVLKLLRRHAPVDVKTGGGNLATAQKRLDRIHLKQKRQTEYWKCSPQQRSEMLACGAARAFTTQVDHAYKRGVSWNLTRGEWWEIWKNSGKWEKRGRSGYVMCRVEDDGAYEVGNVYIGLARHNVADARRYAAGDPACVVRIMGSFSAQRVVNRAPTVIGVYATAQEAYDAFAGAQ